MPHAAFVRGLILKPIFPLSFTAAVLHGSNCQEPIRIGFLADITGSMANLSMAGLNAAGYGPVQGTPCNEPGYIKGRRDAGQGHAGNTC